MQMDTCYHADADCGCGIRVDVEAHFEAMADAGTVTARIDLRPSRSAPAPEPAARRTVVVALDRSEAMGGDRLQAAQQAVLEVIERLEDLDRFGLVALDGAATILTPVGCVVDLGRERIRRDLAAITTAGMVDLCAGYLQGLQQARRGGGCAGAAVILLTGGHADAAVADPRGLCREAGSAAAQSITTCTIGIGSDCPGPLLTALAEAGNGQHTCAEHPAAVSAAMVGQLGRPLSRAGRAATIMVRPASSGVRVGLLNNGPPAHLMGGGMLVELGDLYARERRSVLLTFDLPPVAGRDLTPVASITVAYSEIPHLVRHTVTLPVSVNRALGDASADRCSGAGMAQAQLLPMQQAQAQCGVAQKPSDVDVAAESRASSESRSVSGGPGGGGVNNEAAEGKGWLGSLRAALPGFRGTLPR